MKNSINTSSLVIFLMALFYCMPSTAVFAQSDSRNCIVIEYVRVLYINFGDGKTEKVKLEEDKALPTQEYKNFTANQVVDVLNSLSKEGYKLISVKDNINGPMMYFLAKD